MTKEEYKRWVKFMQGCRGQWTIDHVHDGNDGQDLLLFYPHPVRQGVGVFIGVKQNGEVTAGTYEDAFPHIGEATFQRRWSKKFGSYTAARAKVLERTLMINRGR